MSEEEINQRLRDDLELQEMLTLVATLELPDWWMCAGYVRSIVWAENRYERPDIDIVYFDPIDLSEVTEKRHEGQLRRLSDVPWSVKNQARMHLINGLPPYKSAKDAISQFPETVTSIGVTKRPDFELYLPYGANDFADRIIRPTPAFQNDDDRYKIYRQRVIEKGWLTDPTFHVE